MPPAWNEFNRKPRRVSFGDDPGAVNHPSDIVPSERNHPYTVKSKTKITKSIYVKFKPISSTLGCLIGDGGRDRKQLETKMVATVNFNVTCALLRDAPSLQKCTMQNGNPPTTPQRSKNS